MFHKNSRKRNIIKICCIFILLSSQGIDAFTINTPGKKYQIADNEKYQDFLLKEEQRKSKNKHHEPLKNIDATTNYSKSNKNSSSSSFRTIIKYNTSNANMLKNFSSSLYTSSKFSIKNMSSTLRHFRSWYCKADHIYPITYE